MKNEQIAYNKGYRITESGELYHLNGRKYKTTATRSGIRFHINIGNKKSIAVSVGRLQAFQKFGDEFFKYKRITYLDSDIYNTSIENVALGKGAERLKRLGVSKNLHREQIAQKLGFSVTKNGVLLKNGVESHWYLNNNGYKMFKISVGFKQSIGVLVHRLQAFQKFGVELYAMPLVRHLDGDSLNNVYDNLLLGNHLDNYNDIPSEEQVERYRKSAFSHTKYTPEEREKFRENFNSDVETISSYARRCNVAQRTMYSIIKQESKYLDNGR